MHYGKKKKLWGVWIVEEALREERCGGEETEEDEVEWEEEGAPLEAEEHGVATPLLAKELKEHRKPMLVKPPSEAAGLPPCARDDCQTERRASARTRRFSHAAYIAPRVLGEAWRGTLLYGAQGAVLANCRSAEARREFRCEKEVRPPRCATAAPLRRRGSARERSAETHFHARTPCSAPPQRETARRRSA